jgi:hemolysin D
MKPYKLFSCFKANLDHDPDPRLSITTQEEYLQDLQFSREEREQTDQIYGGIAGSVSFPRVTPPLTDVAAQKSPHLSSIPVAKKDWSNALQSLLDQPPASFPLQLMLGGFIFCGAFVAWGYFGTVDEVGQARGQLAPQGQVYKIHPVELGKVSQILIKEGQTVKKGEVLAELDRQIATTELTRLQQQLTALKAELTQKQSLIERIHLEAQTQSAIAEAQIQAQQASIERVKSQIVSNQRLLNQLNFEAKVTQERVESLQPLKAETQTLIEKLQEGELAAQQRLERLKPLLESGAISKDLVFQAEQNLRDQQRAIVQAQLSEKNSTQEQIFQAEQSFRDRQRLITQSQGELKQSQVEIEQLNAELAQRKAEAKTIQVATQQKIQQTELEVTQLQAQIKDTQNLIAMAEAKLQERYLYSPVDGIVSSLNVFNQGEVIQPGQTVAEITPKNAPLILTASLPNDKAGFVKTGMSVKVKFDAYPYQNYGVFEGTVQSISPDTKIDQGVGPVYKLEIVLKKNYVLQQEQKIQLRPGQTASADIIIRRRRILDILLNPILQLQKNGIDL